MGQRKRTSFKIQDKATFTPVLVIDSNNGQRKPASESKDIEDKVKELLDMNNSPSASTGVSKIVKAGLEDQWKSYSGNCFSFYMKAKFLVTRLKNETKKLKTSKESGPYTVVGTQDSISCMIGQGALDTKNIKLAVLDKA
ncbi:hypothetical protein QYM36_019956, partial [Artemia franciscana]